MLKAFHGPYYIYAFTIISAKAIKPWPARCSPAYHFDKGGGEERAQGFGGGDGRLVRSNASSTSARSLSTARYSRSSAETIAFPASATPFELLLGQSVWIHEQKTVRRM